MKVKLYDLIGVKSGVHYYLKAFRKLLQDHQISTEIYSNFNVEGKRDYLPNIFAKPSILYRASNLLLCYFKYLTAILRLGKEDYIIVSLYGLAIDIPLLFISRLSKRVLLDVHEFAALDNKKGVIDKLFKYLYKTSPNVILIHSKKIKAELDEVGFKKQLLIMPHVHYNLDLEVTFDESKVSDDIKNAFKPGIIYFLFFGAIRHSKGIMELLAASELLTNEKIKILIAGQDVSSIMQEYNAAHPDNKNITSILRLIGDDEVKYLFTKSNYMLQPYTNISQSGVTEMSITFKKPLIASDIEYFRDIFKSYPSFGVRIDTNDPVAFSECINDMAINGDSRNFYTEADFQAYFQGDEFNEFINNQLKALNKTLNKV